MFGRPGQKLYGLLAVALIAILVASCGGPTTPTPTPTPSPSPTTTTPTPSPSPTPKPAPTVTVTVTATPTPTASPLAVSVLPLGKVGTAYNGQLVPGGGRPPYTWSVAAGNLPVGIDLASSGAIRGTPSSAGSFEFTAQVKDGAGATASGVLTIAIAPAALTVRSTLPTLRVGTNYSIALEASGGFPPYTWTLTSGSVPAGLTMNSSGVISGTTTSLGTANFTVQVADASRPPAIAQAQLSLAVTPPPIIVSAALPLANQGMRYSATLTASGGVAPYRWTVTSGELPAGLTMTPDGGINGTPTTVGTYSFTVEVADSTSPPLVVQQALSIAVSRFTPSPLTIVSTLMPIGNRGVNYSTQLVATGGVPPYVWSIASGSLPPGLNMTASGAVSGTPTFAGSFTFTVRAKDSSLDTPAIERSFYAIIAP